MTDVLIPLTYCIVAEYNIKNFKKKKMSKMYQVKKSFGTDNANILKKYVEMENFKEEDLLYSALLQHCMFHPNVLSGGRKMQC